MEKWLGSKPLQQEYLELLTDDFAAIDVPLDVKQKGIYV